MLVSISPLDWCASYFSRLHRWWMILLMIKLNVPRQHRSLTGDKAQKSGLATGVLIRRCSYLHSLEPVEKALEALNP